MTIPSGGYPKQPFGVDPQTGKTTNLVRPAGHPQQYRYVVFQNANDENSFDGNAVPASGLTGVIENKHSR